MYSKSCLRQISLILLTLILFIMSGCTNIIKTFQERNSKAFTVKSGKMLHVKQLLEHYDSSGQPVPQYYELWLTDKKGFCVELDKDGKEIRAMLDVDGKHISYDSKTREAAKSDSSQIFMLNFNKLKSSYSKSFQAEDQQYAGRNCAIYLLENSSDEDWLKIYRDKETGYVLLCDAPLFRVKTALLEVLPIDDKLFTAPADITFK